MDEGWVERIMAMFRSRVETAADALGLAMVDDIKEAISEPVVRGEGGAVIGRSAEGDDPFLETGNLRESETHNVSTEGNIITLNIVNTAWYARRLHDGHPGETGGFGEAGPRPFHDLALARWEGRIPSEMIEAISGSLVAVA